MSVFISLFYTQEWLSGSEKPPFFWSFSEKLRSKFGQSSLQSTKNCHGTNCHQTLRFAIIKYWSCGCLFSTFPWLIDCSIKCQISMPNQTHQPLFKKCMYRKVTSTNTSHLEAHLALAFSFFLWRGNLMLMFCDLLGKSWFTIIIIKH